MPALFTRDPNAPTMSNPFQSSETVAAAVGQENQMQDAQQHKQVLEKKGAADKNNPHFVSPSDAIMSPASQKLSSFKQRQINKQNGGDSTRRSLFARSVSGNSEQSVDEAK
ncbi:hypothetical protein WHR41_00671 [Cladosporium halotolerans]|uniref:Uncharacterized protein n=1 Tax=Cladosporium halotolerans TaxID=1052096 RepID=A0AB34L448_9PEZI